ncbi:DMT family transporter [Croceibacterium ferulae]|uniref:DMT family transporter n=1 Tax=Croceibacterium ferulae TaxID=1854641 RepID=UPI000EAFD50B|nr:DMT family transporter [Croceibacterium ferulae]
MLATAAWRERLHLTGSVQAVLFCCLGVLLFACMDATIKYLAMRHDVPIIVAVRYLVNWLLLVAIVGPVCRGRLVRTHRTGLVLVRACSLAVASLLVGLALQRMPVAETTAINFLAPMLVVVVAGPLLGEKVGAASWATALIGFGGVLLIARPGSGLELTGLACALAAVGANVAYQLLSRTLARTERTTALLFYAALVGTVIFGIMGLWLWEGEFATGLELVLFLSLGVYGGLGHYLFTAAYRHADASVLAPLSYLQLFWAGLLGWLIFGHLPDWLSVIGMILIAGSGVGAAIRR